MNGNVSQIELLRENVFGLIAESRKMLANGQVDLSPVSDAVRSFCEALAAMPVEEARPYTEDLHALSREMNALERELQAARDIVQRQLGEYGQMHKAHRAYQKSDGIGEKYFAPETEGDE